MVKSQCWEICKLCYLNVSPRKGNGVTQGQRYREYLWLGWESNPWPSDHDHRSSTGWATRAESSRTSRRSGFDHTMKIHYFLCYVSSYWGLVILYWSPLFSLFNVIHEFDRFLHRGWAEKRTVEPSGNYAWCCLGLTLRNSTGGVVSSTESEESERFHFLTKLFWNLKRKASKPINHNTSSQMPRVLTTPVL